MRATNPISGLGLAVYGHRAEDAMWAETLRNLAPHLGKLDATPTTSVVCVDTRRQWKRIGNLRHDAVLHTTLHLLRTPFRAVARWIR